DRNRSHWSTSKTPSYTKSVSWQHHRCRIGQTPQNDVSDAIPQRLPDDLQSVLVGEFYEIFGQRVY
ncbi:hypothetical protein P2N20_24890, partial [Escherichia coli]